MKKITRRDSLQGALGVIAAAAASPMPAAAKAIRRSTPGKPGIKFALMMGPRPDRTSTIGRQVGVNHGIAGVLGTLKDARRSDYEGILAKVKSDYKEAGVTIDGVESHPVPAEKIKLGLPGRDEEIENYIAAIKALGNTGIPVLCYNFMAGLGWYRTKVNAPGRGGALITIFDNKDAKEQGLTEWGEISEDKMWDNITYFLKAVIPVAEKAGVKMALHPDDPPLSPLRGIGRIVTSAANYRRIMNIVPSPVNGVTYCQANFVLMGEDIEALAKEWCAQKKIFFVHFRDVAGTKENFRETFHDQGVTDMARMLKVYHEAGFDGPMRPDHAPTMEGEANDKPGYALNGKIFAFGYMKGIMEGLGYPYS